MTKTDSLAYSTDRETSEGQLELTAELWHLQNKRLIKMNKYFSASIGMQHSQASPLKIYRKEEESLNEADIYLLREELQTFMQALIQHPILLPTSFSQQLSMEGKVYSIRLKSCEPFKDFTERLSDALLKLG